MSNKKQFVSLGERKNGRISKMQEHELENFLMTLRELVDVEAPYNVQRPFMFITQRTWDMAVRSGQVQGAYRAKEDILEAIEAYIKKLIKEDNVGITKK